MEHGPGADPQAPPAHRPPQIILFLFSLTHIHVLSTLTECGNFDYQSQALVSYQEDNGFTHLFGELSLPPTNYPSQSPGSGSSGPCTHSRFPQLQTRGEGVGP